MIMSEYNGYVIAEIYGIYVQIYYDSLSSKHLQPLSTALSHFCFTPHFPQSSTPGIDNHI